MKSCLINCLLRKRVARAKTNVIDCVIYKQQTDVDGVSIIHIQIYTVVWTYDQLTDFINSFKAFQMFTQTKMLVTCNCTPRYHLVSLFPVYICTAHDHGMTIFKNNAYNKYVKYFSLKHRISPTE